MDFKLPERFEISNKASYGRVLNIAGSDYMPGAAYLSSVSALKIGCGYCFLCSTERVINAVAAQTQNVVFVPLKDLENHLNNADVVELGCGLSQDEQAVEIFNRTILNVSKDIPFIVDADGLNILSMNNNNFLKRGFKNVIFTPHPKKASRLLECSLTDVLNNFEDSSI